MRYRAEIDGLRAVAVIPVILFHAGFKVFQGGFVGVDIFFVISGYLITTIILTELEAGKFSIVNFYERRARRILPALFVVMATCIPFAWLWLIPSDMKEFSQSLVAVSVFASNILFWRESGYFETDAELKPLLHTWSLAVEEQFYVLFPLFLMLAWRLGKRRIVALLALVSLVSLGLAHWGSLTIPAATFFLLPTRSWELAIGSFIAFYFSKKERTGLPLVWNQLLSFTGLGLIIFSIFEFSESTPFPSLYALVPTVGAAFIILFAWPSTLVGSLLGSKLLVSIGLISYSAYLWHQPLFAFARLRSLDKPSLEVFAFLSVTTLVLAYFSLHLVEKPFRQKREGKFFQRPAIFSYALSMSTIFIVSGLSIDNTSYYNNKLTLEQRHFLSYLNYSKTELLTKGSRHLKCFLNSERSDFKYYDKGFCLSNAVGKSNFLLMGDSHGAHLWHGLASNFPTVNVLQATSSGCKPLINATGAKHCTDLTQFIFKHYLLENKIDGVILSARWYRQDLDGILPTIEYLKRYVNTVIVVGPTIEYTRPLPIILAYSNGLMNKEVPMHSRFLVEERFEIAHEISQIVANSHATYIDIISAVCSDQVCRTTTKSDEPITFDYGHYTISGSQFVISRLRERHTLRLEQ